MSDQRCDGCRYWLPFVQSGETEGTAEFGQCRGGLRHVQTAPDPDMYPGQNWAWPIHERDDWCGQWAAKGGDPASRLASTALGVSRRVHNLIDLCLGQDATLSDVCGLTADRWLEEQDFGSTSLSELKRALAAHGLHLRGDPPPVPTKDT